MPITGRVHWEAGGIATVLSYGFDETEVHRSTTGIGGVYSEITGPGTRITLVAGTEDYYYDDTAAELTYYYKIRHLKTGTGLNSDFCEPFTFAGTGVTDITDLPVLAAYLSPNDLQAAWVSMDQYAMALTEGGFNDTGNRPYVIGSDWSVVLALCYTDETTGYREGRNLSGATVTAVIKDKAGTVIVTKDNSALGGITLRAQGTLRVNGGTRGELVLSFTDAEATSYAAGLYDLRITVTWPDSDVSCDVRGKIEFLGA